MSLLRETLACAAALSLLGCGAGGPTTPELAVDRPGGSGPVAPRWTPTSDDRGDALNYFLGTKTRPGIGNQGPTRALVLEWEGDNHHGFATWSKVPTDRPAYEVYEWDRDWIYLREDRNGGVEPDYGFTRQKWMPRRITSGWTETMVGNQIFFFSGPPPTCEVAERVAASCPQWLRDTSPSPDCRRGWPAQQELLGIFGDELKVQYLSAEIFSYSFDYGWVGWSYQGERGDVSLRFDLRVPAVGFGGRSCGL